MKMTWTTEELVQHFTIQADEQEFLGSNAPHNQLGKAVLLKYFQYEARFPITPNDVPQPIVEFLAQQLYLTSGDFDQYQWEGTRMREHRQAIRTWLGFRQASVDDQQAIQEWLRSEVLPDEHRPQHLQQSVYRQLREQQLEPPTDTQVERLVAAAIYQYQQQFFQQTYARLPIAVRVRLRQLLLEASIWQEQTAGYAPLHEMKLGAGAATVKHIQRVCDRLKGLQAIELPEDLFDDLPLSYLQQYQRQVSVESPSHLLRRKGTAPEQMYTLLAAFCWVRQRQVTDDLVDLFIRVLQNIKIKAEREEKKHLIADFIRVEGKQQLLFDLAEVMLNHPDGIIEEVLYPVVGQARLEALVEEARQTGTYRQAVQTRIGSSYSYHYRQMLPPILEVLEFRSNNARHQPLIGALKVVETYLEDKGRYFYPIDAVIPIDGVIPGVLQTWIYEPNRSGKRQVRRTRYELCVLQQLRDRLRRKAIWVVGADRHRNPDHDTPADFDDKRTAYYQALNLPLDADEFITRLQHEMTSALTLLHDGLTDNPFVSIMASGRIRLQKLKKQTESANLLYLHNHVKQQWQMISLLDVLKEADLRTDFTQHFHSLTGQSRLPQDELRQRLLLGLYGFGTNTGVSRVSAGNPDVSDSQLKYMRRRFISTEGLRAAIAHLVNATLAVKDPAIWGEAATWSASDSKQFGAWDQNLRAQWHQRYRGAGVMVYWHVSKQSLCIYSQLKAPSSSEAASMIEGVLRHCTAMQVDRSYVDTHGQSEVAFAFCRLLGFQLMPRLKNIYEQRLHLPHKEDIVKYPELEPILRSVIDWDLIRHEYDEMVKYATALRLGTAQTEAILKRFTRSNIQHPTYKAFSELGRAIKTIFLCRYLHDIEVRQEIFEGLNVIENWNSANGFIFYGKHGDIATNDVDAQEVTILAMHLLQTSLVYVNTLIVQQVLADPAWRERFTQADWRGLTPLFYRHINPYGRFDLDMSYRIPLVA